MSLPLEANQVSPALGVKVGYLYLAAPISGLFFIIFSIEHLLGIFSGESSAEETTAEPGGDL